MWKKTKYFARAGDFSEYDLPVLLHLECEMTKDRMHKLEILEAGKKTYSEMIEIGSRIFQGEPESWGLLRVDLTADIEGVPVQWFKDHTYVTSKQTTREIGTIKPIPYMAIRKGRAETLYAGVKPNQHRIYDKVAEQLQRHNRAIQRAVREARQNAAVAEFAPGDRPNDGEWETFTNKIEYEEPIPGRVLTMPSVPSFKDVYGYGPEHVLTRVERQVAQRDLEKIGLTNVYSLKRATEIKPFKSLRFFQTQGDDLSIETWGWRDWNAGMNMRNIKEQIGLNEFKKMMERELGNNFYRNWNKFRPFVENSAIAGTRPEELQAAYERSTNRQVA